MLPPPPNGNGVGDPDGEPKPLPPPLPNSDGDDFAAPNGDGDAADPNGFAELAPDPKSELGVAEPKADGVLDDELEAKGEEAKGANMEGFGVVDVDADVEVEAGNANGFAGAGGSATPLVFGAAGVDVAGLPKPANAAGAAGILSGAAGALKGAGAEDGGGAPNGDGDGADERAGTSVLAVRSSYSFWTSTRRLL